MCVRVNCNSCGKPTYAGCGAHVDQVLRGVPVDQRCACSREKKTKTTKPRWWPF